MKNLLLTIALICVTGLAFGQLKVVAPNGDVGIGTSTPTEKLEVDGLAKSKGNTVEQTGASGTTLYERTDGAAVITGAGFSSGGFTFDENYDFDIRSRGRAQVKARLLSAGTLLIKGQGSTGRVGINVVAPAEMLHVNGDAQANGMWINSDAKLKSDITTFNYGLDEVLQLKPVSYQYNNRNVHHRSIGLVAQDLQEVAPELVSTFTHATENEKGEIIKEEEFLKIYDTGIKYMLVNAIQEQQAMIETLQAQVAALQTTGGATTPNNGASDFSQQQMVLSNLNSQEISKISPNPFTQVARIDYNLPRDFSSATVTVYDLDGQLINQVSLDSRIGTVEVEAAQLSSGMYTYTIEVDGEVVDTKKFIKE